MEGWAAIEQGRVQRAEIQVMAREIVAACRGSRARVQRAEEIYTKYREYLPNADRQKMLRLMADTLLYIQYGGVRIKTTQDPKLILGR